MSQSEEALNSDTTPTGSDFHLGPQSPDPDPTPVPDISPHDFNHSAVETENEELILEQQLQNLDLKVETEGEGKEKHEEAEEKDDGDRESDNDADGNPSGDEDNEGEEERNEDEVDGENVKKNEGKRSQYPVRPEAEDCAYYMKTGLCKFAYNCKFNHPLRRKNQAVKEKDESMEKPSQTECKYYLRTGGCKFGNACRYSHSTAKSSAGQILELNFLGLPIRQGERECPYYMRNGSCKYGTNCRFNHPDPTTTGVCDQPSGYGNGGSVSSQAAPQVNMVPWSSPRALNETAAYMPVMFPPPQVVSPPNLEWNGYQTPVYPLERSLHATPAYVMNNPGTETAAYTHNQPQMVADEFPARPGQPECSYFLRTGDCKFKSNCKYHHPRNRVAKPTPFALSDKGLPLRPDQTICSHYSRYGICKFGPACKFDHSKQEATSAMSGLDDQPPTFSHSAATEQTRVAGATDTTA
ncbi:hypothetical protein like AT5G63260 [Hibiscus trionum]|uniref:C3H1-type domain-containing protein n=1 Tax=Hibiscus trionum TaxID=183268 RepID=A0A9W7IRG1_HIBTR|nr:hypothetical protein like AT5G63260 [Hibiscus trionum]